MRYSNKQINNNIRRVIEEGKSNHDALDLFLRMNMMNDLGTERSFVKNLISATLLSSRDTTVFLRFS